MGPLGEEWEEAEVKTTVLMLTEESGSVGFAILLYGVCRVLEVWEGSTSFRGVDEREVCPQMPELETASCKGRNPDKGPALVFRCDTGYSQRAEECQGIKMLLKCLTSGPGNLFQDLSFSRLIS